MTFQECTVGCGIWYEMGLLDADGDEKRKDPGP
jgi:hypothetical protein